MIALYNVFPQVIIMPHSHNDPGWLKTYEGYFNHATKHILDNAVSKMVTQFKDLLVFPYSCLSTVHPS